MWRYAVPDVTVRLEALVAPPSLAAALAARGAGGGIGEAGVEGLFIATPLRLADQLELLLPKIGRGAREDLETVIGEDDDLPVVLGGVVVVEAGGAGAGRGDTADISRGGVRAGFELEGGEGHWSSVVELGVRSTAGTGRFRCVIG